MATLLFYDDSHRYTVDGEEVPSVSELLRFLTRELYNDAPQFVLDQAAAKGTKVHRATEAIDKFGSAEVDDEVLPYVQAYVQFVKDSNPEWEKIEWSVCNEKLYAGTVDRYGTLNEKKVLIDIKTTQSITGLHKVCYSAQLNLYRLAVLKESPVDEMYVLQLKKDGTYKLIPIEPGDDLALACLTMHEAIKNSKKRRKKKDAEG